MAKTKVIDEHEFAKESLLRCSRYKDNRDLLNALLSDDMLYTLDEVESMIAQYYGKEVH